jgi:hypothetical protein
VIDGRIAFIGGGAQGDAFLYAASCRMRRMVTATTEMPIMAATIPRPYSAVVLIDTAVEVVVTDDVTTVVAVEMTVAVAVSVEVWGVEVTTLVAV